MTVILLASFQPWSSFNPHAYVRHDFCQPSSHWYCQSFNPHAYVRHDMQMGMLFLRQKMGFNPHAYVRHDYPAFRKVDRNFVSIHMPTWGMTKPFEWLKNHSMFQSTCLREAWPGAHLPWRPYSPVSIHMPTWGMTIRLSVKWTVILFQSTCLREAWPSLSSD